MRRFFRSTAFKICIVVVLALFAGSLLATHLHGNTTPVNIVVGTVLAPLQRASAFVADQLSTVRFSFRSSAHLSDEVERLQKEVEDLQSQLVDYEKAKEKITLYEEFLELKESNQDYQFTSASIVGRGAENPSGTFVLNRGSKHGILVNDPVIHGKSLVGVVTSVTPMTATVKTLLNPEISVGVYETGVGTTGYVTTTTELAKDGLCRMPGLPNNTSISPGGTVCTSGTSGTYPQDLIIGTVLRVEDDAMDISSYAVIEPAAPFDKLKDVFVITGFEGQANRAQEDAS